MATIVFDTEIFDNIFLFCGRVVENRELIVIWNDQEGYQERLKEVMESGCTFVSFNGNKFDLPFITAAIAGMPQDKLKMLANAIIEQELMPWDVYRRLKLKEPEIDHIDLIEVAPGTFSSLKAYGARMHMPILQDMPFRHDEFIFYEQYMDVLDYCVNDIDTTEALYNNLKGAMDIRVTMGKEYGIDFRSKSDTQMAETAFVKRLELRRGQREIPEHITYSMPDFIKFDSPQLKELAERIQETVYLMNQKTGHVILPDFLAKEQVKLNNGTYQLGVGGIHSTHDTKVCHVASKDYIITDIDAASFYPSIIINCNLIPQNMGQRFIDEYRAIYHRRLEAKRKGDKAVNETLKISLNGTFGKTASRWSPLYSPDLALAITLTGQLTLLSLIEKLETVGAVTLSANTDGIAIGFPYNEVSIEVERVVKEFSELSKFEFEYTPYRVLAIKDVNNYIAITSGKKVKAKGLYAEQDLKKNPTAQICSKAVANWLLSGESFEKTLKTGEFKEFISARGVTGGGVQGKEYLGKVVRWYMSTDKSLPPLTYRTNGNQVPKTEGARACMRINGAFPDDLDWEWYRKEAIKIAVAVGAEEFLTDEERALVAPPPKKGRKSK